MSRRDLPPDHFAALRSAEFSRILFIKPSALGDVVHAMPVLAKLRARYPAARIDWLVTPENAELVRCHPALTGTVIFARRELAKAGRSWRATRELFAFLKKLREPRYDLVIDLHGQLRSAFFSLVIGAPVRIGFDRPAPRAPDAATAHGWRGAREGSWLAYTHRIPIPTLDVHAIDRYLWLAPMLGLDAGPPDQTLYLPPEAARAIDRLLTGAAAAKPLAVIAPGTMWETKHWTPEGFAKVAAELLRGGFTVALAGSPRDRERCARIAADAPGALDFSGKTTPAELAELISRAEICVSNDSGAMHLAAALGRPVVSIFGPTNARHVGPYGQPENVVRRDLPCSPCNFRRLSQCPYGHACMRGLAAETVIQRVREILHAAPRGAAPTLADAVSPTPKLRASSPR